MGGGEGRGGRRDDASANGMDSMEGGREEGREGAGSREEAWNLESQGDDDDEFRGPGGRIYSQRRPSAQCPAAPQGPADCSDCRPPLRAPVEVLPVFGLNSWDRFSPNHFTQVSMTPRSHYSPANGEISPP
ncbi:hypothetical protein KC19_9G013200 [Ceratodon purpureus]|uniref:Uncharacterized protein n=1 Tax=Ceratodon purpureus TaxID=3225 RepID=A0A8T0GQC6_CERPU|nr:hypothetical protein KC19_9G013200 [Ceratodon purpureus]